MKLYVVGGAVRDRLLGLPASDRDWVAVGATPEELVALGYRPVGKDFPVFLHPGTHEEVALARTERKTGRGYHGFVFHASPEVTLEEDLARRDLTVNAIAEAEDGTLVDPFGGQRDLAARVFRHVSPAFAEDPVRLLRVARLSARFPDFAIAPETQALLARLVADGEVDALVPERVWQELVRGLAAARPSRMLAVLDGCGALARLLPGLEGRWHGVAAALDDAGAAAPDTRLEVRAALLLSPLGAAGAEAAARRLKADAETIWLAGRLPASHAALQALAARLPAAAGDATLAEALITGFDAHDGWRRPDRFAAITEASDRLAAPAGTARALLPLLEATRALPTAEVAAAAARDGARGEAVGVAVREARRRFVAGLLTSPRAPTA